MIFLREREPTKTHWILNKIRDCPVTEFGFLRSIEFVDREKRKNSREWE